MPPNNGSWEPRRYSALGRARRRRRSRSRRRAREPRGAEREALPDARGRAPAPGASRGSARASRRVARPRAPPPHGPARAPVARAAAARRDSLPEPFGPVRRAAVSRARLLFFAADPPRAPGIGATAAPSGPTRRRAGARGLRRRAALAFFAPSTRSSRRVEGRAAGYSPGDAVPYVQAPSRRRGARAPGRGPSASGGGTTASAGSRGRI